MIQHIPDLNIYPVVLLMLARSSMHVESTDLFMYSITTFSSYEDGSVSEVTRPLSAAQHQKLKADLADPTRPTVRQRRVTFSWERQIFELHTDVEPAHGVSVLHRRSEVRINQSSNQSISLSSVSLS